jgi:hypothetical protein
MCLQPYDGRVGIGTTSPNYTLDVDGSLNCTELRIGGNSLTNDDNRIDASGIAGGAVTNREFDFLSGLSENIQSQLDDRLTDTDLSGYYKSGQGTLQVGSGTYNYSTQSRFKVKAYGTTSMYGIGAEYRMNWDRSRSLFLHA